MKLKSKKISKTRKSTKLVKKPKTKRVRGYKLIDITLEKGIKGPSIDAKYNIQPGQFAKVIFSEKDVPQRERMWVKVEKRGSNGKYYGILDNKPVIMKNVKLGDKIGFTTRNIIAIMK